MTTPFPLPSVTSFPGFFSAVQASSPFAEGVSTVIFFLAFAWFLGYGLPMAIAGALAISVIVTTAFWVMGLLAVEWVEAAIVGLAVALFLLYLTRPSGN